MKGLAISTYMLLFCAGCASLPSAQDTVRAPLVGDAAASIIIEDLSGVLGQILDPLETTTQFGTPKTAFGQKVIVELRRQSYGMQRVSNDEGANFLQYSEAVSTTSNKEKQYKYRLAIGEVSVERVYEFQRGDIFPKAPMVVRGSERSAALDTALFVASDSELGFIHQIYYGERDLPSVAVPTVSLVTEQLVSEITANALSLNSLDLPAEVGVNATNTDTNNIYYTNESNFTRITRNYDEILRDTILFADDSMRLGITGKKQVRNILDTFDKDSDFINLIGCSQGITKHELGNEGLALGRSKRVFDEFVSLGVSKTSLLDEGCWATEASQARYPGRAVIVIIKRRRS